VSNRIEDCLFQDLTYGCGVLLSTTFDVGTNTFSGTTVVQRCDLIRCGGYDPGGWRAAFEFCMQNNSITNVNVNNLNIIDSISYGWTLLMETCLQMSWLVNYTCLITGSVPAGGMVYGLKVTPWVA